MEAAVSIRPAGQGRHRTGLALAVAVAALLVPAGAARAQSSLWTQVQSGTGNAITAGPPERCPVVSGPEGSAPFM